jgi:microcystin-dependent protein
MSQPYIGEIRLFPYFAGVPKNWALCDGRLMAPGANAALFKLIGTTYGGDGKNTFALPDLRGRAPIHTAPTCGVMQGTENVTLLVENLPQHIHDFVADNADGNVSADSGNYLANSQPALIFSSPQSVLPLAPASIASSGGSQPHPNMQPYLVMQYCISLVGEYPAPPGS